MTNFLALLTLGCSFLMFSAIEQENSTASLVFCILTVICAAILYKTVRKFNNNPNNNQEEDEKI